MIRKFMAALLLFFFLVPASAICVESGSLRAFLYGDGPGAGYDCWIAHLAEGIANPEYNDYAPYDAQTNGFGDFLIDPTREKLNTWERALDLFLAGNYATAQVTLDLAGMPFEIVEFHDSDTARTFYLIRELPDPLYSDDNGTATTTDDEHGAFAYGWGLYVYNPAGTRPILVSVPHPCDDFPAPAFALNAFQTWNAKFLLINGAGREVRWNNVGIYDNGKSLSDPSRNAEHPFNSAYQRFANLIRSEFDAREWSAQIHSYDWNDHDGFANVQISAGNNKLCPNLPIRDLSSLKHDLINSGEYLMVPEDEVGNNSEVGINGFYAVKYSVHAFTFEDGEHSVAVNSNVDLPAYSQNRQMLYTLSGWNDYDSYEPFFHAEMDELPSSYRENANNYEWFYGWNNPNGDWDWNNLFTNFLAYYGRWIADMESVLDAAFAMDDLAPPSTPTDLAITAWTEDSVTLAWNRSSAYDFHSYEILCARVPISGSNFWLYDRYDYPFLASQGCETIKITGLDTSLQHYFQIRAVDKNGEYSSLSNEVTLYPEPPCIAVEPLALDFGAQAVGSSAILQFYVHNSGDATLLGSIATPEGYTVAEGLRTQRKQEWSALSAPGTRNTLDFSIGAESSLAFELTFAPTEARDYSGSLEISSNDADNPIVSTPVSGTAFHPQLYARAKAFLQGPYQSGGSMEHNLAAVLPLTSPYNPEHGVDALPDVAPHFIVDWVYLQLRTSATGPVEKSQSAFLLENGELADLAGNPVLVFAECSATDYYIILRHRNHLGIMSASAHTLALTPDAAPLIDLSLPGSVYGGNQAGVKQVEPGVLAMVSGDADQSGSVLPSDLNLHWRVQTGLYGYLAADFDLSGAVLPSDLNLHWRLNTGLQSQIPAPATGKTFQTRNY